MENLSLGQRKEFLKVFTRELVHNSIKKIEIYRLEKLIEEKYGIPSSEDRREVVKAIVERRAQIRKEILEKKDLKTSMKDWSTYTPSTFKLRSSGYVFPGIGAKRIVKKAPLKRKSLFKPSVQPKPRRVLRIPEPRLPPRLNYLKPGANSFEQVNLGKILPLAKDLNVKLIEVDGPGKNVSVSGIMGKKNTGIHLNNEEIDSIINEFSSKAKIPISEGFNKIAYGGFILKAIVSEEMDKRFSLSKIEESRGSGINIVPAGHIKRRVYSS